MLQTGRATSRSNIKAFLISSNIWFLKARSSARSISPINWKGGGEINAFTAKEHVCFHTETLKEDLELSIHVLSELIATAAFEADAVEKEKGVVLQEILMSKDDIEDSVFDNFFARLFPGSPLGTNILGTAESVSSLTREKIMEWYKNVYTRTLIVSVTGNVDHGKVVALVEKYLGGEEKNRCV